MLQDSDLAVEEGEDLVLLGLSGTGKTTLINLMTGLEVPSRGTVHYRGEPVTGGDLFLAGDFAEAETRADIVFGDPGCGVCKRLVIEGDRLVGAVM